MPKPLQTPDRLFDRTWRPGHPYHPRLTGRRRVGMLIVFVLLCGVIGAYRYFTNADRVRHQAEQYLALFTGGNVEVGRATLSVFEGLRLDDVRVYIGATKSPESLIFTASTFRVQISPAALLSGRIDATRIVATDPHVRLTENVATQRWNYSDLSRSNQSGGSSTQMPITLPEISLRNAMVDYFEFGNPQPIGSVSIDGQLTPGPGDNRYSFKLQSRGASQLIGPRAEGTVAIGTGEISATLWDLEFDRDLRVMLPAEVRNWWQQHGLTGSVKRTELWMDPSAPTYPFKATIQVDNIALTVQPEELLGREEIQRRAWAADAFDVLRAVGLNERGFIDQLAGFITSSPIKLRNVGGLFTFTQDRIDINDLQASVEENRFAINGHYDGYSQDAPASLTLSNVEGHVVEIPREPRYVNSLPPEVREVYNRFRPRGTCTVSVQYLRPEQGAKPQVTGAVNVLDGNFVFEKFPYPLNRATGTISIERDAKSGQESLKISHLRGLGVRGGPNEKSYIEVDGEMGPFGPAIGVTVLVKGKNIASEPALMAAFPPRTRQALKYFDSPGKGEFPRFKGNFTCTIIRFPEEESHWSVVTDIHLDDATGALVSFPYPMEHISGDLTVMDDRIEIREAHLKRGDADLSIKGRVEWDDPDSDSRKSPSATGGSSLRPSLAIIANNVPIDSDLINALPQMQAKWLKRAGATGKFDLTGGLTTNTRSPRAPGDSDTDFTFNLALHDCSLWPQGQTFAIAGLNGGLKLTPQKLVLSDLHGKHGQADVSARGEISWPTSPPEVAIVAEMKNLALDASLYQMLPEAAQKGWAMVQPQGQGTVDAKLTYAGAVVEDDTRAAGAVAAAVDVGPVSVGATTQPAPASFEVVLIPRNLSIMPQAVPYRLDNLSGSVTITPRTVLMQNLLGYHGGAEVHISGTGSNEPDGPWEFQLSGAKMLVDDDLKKAIPGVLQSLIQSSELKGAVGFDFSKLKIWNESSATTKPAVMVVPSKSGPAVRAGSSQAGPGLDPYANVDFAVKLNLSDASMNAGVPLTKINGGAELVGSARMGKLSELNGTLDIASLEITGRPATNLRAEIAKRSGQEAMKLAKFQTQLAGGQLAGQIDWAYPDTGPSRYAMALVLHNADVRAMTGETLPEVQGQLSASLSMEGKYDDPASRRGGGDVAVTGQMYKMPLLLGLLQVTNLSLPITSPFNEGTCRYSIDGTRVTFETIELRAKEMTMSGNGHLDFNTGRVGMSFVTTSTTWPKLPVVSDLLQGARNELLQIHVQGTIEEPSVSASSMNAFVTTVDKIFKGGKPPPDLPPVNKVKKPK